MTPVPMNPMTGRDDMITEGMKPGGAMFHRTDGGGQGVFRLAPGGGGRFRFIF